MKPPAANKAPTARRLALQALRSIEQRSGFSNQILDEQMERYPQMDPRDRALATLLVYGVLRHRQRLDDHIFHAAHRPNKLKGELLWALRIACFELVELARPIAIASSQASHALKKLDPQGRLRPVVGAILRSIDRDWQQREQAWSCTQDLLCLRYSLPGWLAKKWLNDLGEQKALARAKASSQVPWIDLRLSSKVGTREELASALRQDYPNATLDLPPNAPRTIRTRGAGDLAFGPIFQSGQISVQGLASQEAAQCLQVVPGEKILDACCGMGSKTMQILEAMQGQGRLVGVDANSTRLEQVRVQQARLGLCDPSEGLELCVADLCQHDALPQDSRDNYDALLLDAPCTGLGNLARHPELRWSRQASDIQDRARLQRQLLMASIARVRPGGRIVYAVCSLEPQEGPEQIAWALSQPSIAGRTLTLEHEQSWTPEDDHCDGFYAARLRLKA